MGGEGVVWVGVTLGQIAVPCHSKRRPSPFLLVSQPSLT